MQLSYDLNTASKLQFGFSQSVNKGKKNFSGNINGTNVFINDFNLRHLNDVFQLSYERRFVKAKPVFNYEIGLVVINSHQQEISLENFANAVNIDERNLQNSRLQEGGVLLGLQYQKKIDNRFYLGVRSRIYYLLSTSSLEAITLTPTLAYKF